MPLRPLATMRKRKGASGPSYLNLLHGKKLIVGLPLTNTKIVSDSK